MFAAAELVGTTPQYVMLAKQVQSHCPDLLPLVSSGAVNLQHAAEAAPLEPVEGLTRFVYSEEVRS